AWTRSRPSGAYKSRNRSCSSPEKRADGSGRRGIVGREQCAQRLFVSDRLEGVILTDRPGSRDRRARVDGLEKPLEIRERSERIVGALSHARGRVEPSPG